MNNKKNAVILDGYTENPGDLNWDYLESVFNLTVYDRTPKELIVERAKDAEVVIVNKVAITREILEKLPKLEFVATLATGFNQLDTVALRERSIPVSNIPSYSTNAVAQTVFSFILEFTNRIGHYTDSV
ncbi:MAG: D-2-hydroxyacid dehydrogenase, partial [Clostridia bacterium]|nr:D-2-hydroxyacid dehydrogenase [Clostridia bacterium]